MHMFGIFRTVGKEIIEIMFSFEKHDISVFW